MFRVLFILGVLVLVPAAIVFWRTRDRAFLAPKPAGPPLHMVGTSTIGHSDAASPIRSTAPATNDGTRSEVPGRNP